MASRMLGSSLGGRAARCSSPATARHAHANAAIGASLTQMYHAAFPSTINNGGAAAPATGSEEEDRERTTTAPIGEEDPVSRVAEKAADVGGKARRAAEEVKDAGRVVKDQAKEVGEDVKESVKKTRP